MNKKIQANMIEIIDKIFDKIDDDLCLSLIQLDDISEELYSDLIDAVSRELNN